MNSDLNKAADGIGASLIAIVTALVVLAAFVLRWVLRLAWRHRHRVPHGQVIVPALGVCVPVALITGSPVAAVLVVAVVGGWLVGAPALEESYREGGESAPRALALGASTARATTRRLAAVHVRFAWRAACKTAGLQPVRIRRWRLLVVSSARSRALAPTLRGVGVGVGVGVGAGVP